MAIVSISIPSEINAKAEDLARKQKITKSKVFSQALERYNRDVVWQEIKAEGERVAKKLGIESDDDVEKIFGRKAKGRL